MTDASEKPGKSEDVASLAAAGEFDPGDRELVSKPPPPPDPFEGRWVPVSDRTDSEGRHWLAEDRAPLPPRYLLTRWREAHDGKPGAWVGAVPLGRVGMLAAGGGQGKSWALCQLALCVAAGVDWLGTFKVVKEGRVLLALAEEEEEELQRRLYYGARALGLGTQQRDTAADRIVALPMAGRAVALTYSPAELQAQGHVPGLGQLPETEFAQAIRAKLATADDWRLIVLDPISRFAGPDVEVDNAAATRFVQTLESLTRAPGNPTLMVAHHTAKATRGEGSAGSEAGAARGASGLTDAVRWQANLVPVTGEADYLELVPSKSNYAKVGARVLLKRAEHGELKPVDPLDPVAVRIREKREAKREGRSIGGDPPAASRSAQGRGSQLFSVKDP